MILFAYNFKHRKTQDFIFRCLFHKISIECIIAADAVKLNIPKSTIRTKVRNGCLIHPKELAESFNIRYEVLAHNSEECRELLNEIKPEIGLISGARILKEEIVNKFGKGIINFHPGLIPEARGLDAMLWSIYNDTPLGVTSHAIDYRIDAGKILEKTPISVFQDDTFYDISERLYETQLEMIPTSLRNLKNGNFIELDYSKTNYNKKMPPEIEEKTNAKLKDYLKAFSPNDRNP